MRIECMSASLLASGKSNRTYHSGTADREDRDDVVGAGWRRSRDAGRRRPSRMWGLTLWPISAILLYLKSCCMDNHLAAPAHDHSLVNSPCCLPQLSLLSPSAPYFRS